MTNLSTDNVGKAITASICGSWVPVQKWFWVFSGVQPEHR